MRMIKTDIKSPDHIVNKNQTLRTSLDSVFESFSFINLYTNNWEIYKFYLFL